MRLTEQQRAESGVVMVPMEVARRTVGSVEGLLETYREHRERCREAMEQAADDIERLLWRDNLFLQDQAIKDLEALVSALQGKEGEKRSVEQYGKQVLAEIGEERALALAALENGIWVEYNDMQKAWYFDIPHSVQTVWGDTPIKALAAAADALGLSPAHQPSPLTLEMVEKAVDEVWSEFKAREDLSVEARDAVIVALERLEALLRQQMGGANHD